jgi:RNA-directed DNA polymerase
LENQQHGEKQMMASNLMTGASPICGTAWNQINWRKVKQQVRRLQMRIAKATQQEKHGKARALQWILTHSYSAKLLAVKQVTSNTGAKTPGVDGILWKTSREKILAVLSLKRKGYQTQALRRIYIPKKNGKQRPLGIPTMKDRAMQALYLLALEPIAEITADKHSYGFRPERCVADAIDQCFLALARKNSAQWILEGDIKACFDGISHHWLLEHIPMDKAPLRQWLNAGYMEENIFFETEAGTPQGGIISPTLANMTLDGMAEAVKKATARTEKVNFVRYADDFIITGASKDVLEKKIKPAIIQFLHERGLTLSEEKTLITHIDQGLDFLGFNVRKYDGKLLIKPSRKSMKTFVNGLRTIIKSNPTIKTESLIRLLNPKLRGWANYYRHVVSKAIFSKVDEAMYQSLSRWARRRHPHKNAKWLKDQYFCHPGLKIWHFHAKIRDAENRLILLKLIKIAKVRIKRHVKLRAKATPYDSEFISYFEKRRQQQLSLSHGR